MVDGLIVEGALEVVGLVADGTIEGVRVIKILLSENTRSSI